MTPSEQNALQTNDKNKTLFGTHAYAQNFYADLLRV